MKAWKKGAIIGAIVGILGSSGVLQRPAPNIIWISLPLVGALAAKWLKTHKFKSWEKVSIIGGLWGLISIVIWFFFSLVAFGHGRISDFVGYLSMIIFLPGLLGMLVDVWIRDNFLDSVLRASFGTPFVFLVRIFSIILLILIPAAIGAGLSLLLYRGYLKLKTQKM